MWILKKLQADKTIQQARASHLVHPHVVPVALRGRAGCLTFDCGIDHVNW